MTKVTKGSDEYLDGLVGYYSNQFNQGEPKVELTIREWLKSIATNKDWEAYCLKVRFLADQFAKDPTDLNKKALKEAKDKAPCVTPSGVFSDKGKDSTLKTFTRLIAMDIDALYDSLDDAKESLRKDPYVYVIFKSISARGLCVLFRLDPDPKKFKEAFAGLREYLMTTYGFTVKQADASVSNVNRIRYVSFDPDIYYNKEAKVSRFVVTKAEQKRYTPPKNIVHTDNDIEFVVQQIEQKQIEFHDSPGDWYRAGFAIASKYGASGFDYFDRISQFRSDYDQAATQQRYNYLCNNAKGEINIATFYHIAKQLGCNVMCDRTKTMVSVAAMHKKQKAEQPETINAIVEMLKVPFAEAKDIVSQVYSINEPIDTEEDVWDQLRTFLRRQYPMKRNIITRNIEDPEDKPYSEEQLNTVYFDCKKHVDQKITFPDFNRMVNSDLVLEYDPFIVFFNKHKHLNPTGNIDRILASIIVPGVRPAYIKVWFTKWLIGIVASMLGKHSSICFVMAGGQLIGKTQFFRRLLPEELNRQIPFTSYFAETGTQKETDEEILMTKKLIVFDDEFGGKSKKDEKRFKSLSDKQWFSIREPYGRSSKDLRRIAVLCGSCNEMDLLNDTTGNRRIFPVLIERIDFDLYNSVDKLDLLIEAYHLYMAGESHHITLEDKNLLNNSTEDFEAVSLERELLNSCFRVPTSQNEKGADLWDVVNLLGQLEPRTRKHIDLKRLKAEIERAGYQKGRTSTKRGWHMFLTANDIQQQNPAPF